MNWLDLIVFVPLAVVCNTVLPVPFDPVLIYFASRQTPGSAGALAFAGSICAGLAAAADLTMCRQLHRHTREKWLHLLPLWKGRRFYVLTFLFALLPLPFSVVRLAVLRHPPKMVPYQITVAMGRLPRYLLTISLWPNLGLPPSSCIVLLGLGAAYAVIQSLRSRSRQELRQKQSYLD